MLTANCVNSSRSNKSKVSKNTNYVQSSKLDPHLEMALALSASLQPSEKTAPDAPSKCWLPQPPPAVKPNKPFKSKAKSALQVRTEEQRKQQMLEAVSSILEAAAEVVEYTQSGDYRFEAMNNESLLSLQCVQRILWNKSAVKSSQAQDYHLDVFKPYFHVETEGQEFIQKDVDCSGSAVATGAQLTNIECTLIIILNLLHRQESDRRRFGRTRKSQCPKFTQII